MVTRADRTGFAKDPTNVYEPLQGDKDFRLLELQPEIGNEDITIKLSHYSLRSPTGGENAPPPYEAMSYTWGDPAAERFPIIIGTTGYLLVTQNCRSMLQRLRHASETRSLWVDAICVNQEDITERNKQVAMMALIFQNADRVVIDIGEVSATSDLALGILLKFHDRSQAEKACEHVQLGAIQTATNRLFKRPWFGRVWILQEVFMARSGLVICGTTMYPWEIFRSHQMSVIEGPPSYYITLPEKLPFVVQMERCSKRGLYEDARKELLPLLCKSRTFQATDPRDKVFALFSFFTRAALEDISMHTNYDTTNPVPSVFTEITTWLIKNVGLSVLSCVLHRRAKKVVSENLEQALPTWVPDWSDPVELETIIGLSEIYWPLQGSKTTTCIASILNIKDIGSVLKVRGLIVDSVREIIICTPGITGVVVGQEDFNRSCIAYQATKGKSDYTSPVYKYPRPHIYQRRDTFLMDWEKRCGSPIRLKGDERMRSVFAFMSILLRGRQYLLSEEGNFGIVPGTAQVGDIIVILLGANVPFILRKVGDIFHLIGESFIYGLMEGEGLEGIDPSTMYDISAPAPLQDFMIQ